MRIYLDACAIIRLTDDPSQARVRSEADAVELIFLHVRSRRIDWIASSVLQAEFQRNPDTLRRRDALAMLSYATEFHRVSQEAVERARALSLLSYGLFDALHLAVAESAAVDLFLTTDDRLLGKARRGLGRPSIRVANPLDYEQEVTP